MTKVCSKCQCEKAPTEFTKLKRSKDGLNTWCKSCFRQNYQANKQKILEKQKLWVQNNRERSREIKKKWSEANPEKQSLAIRAWQDKNAEHFKTLKKKWREDNSELLRVHTINRRRKLSAGKLSVGIVETLLNLQDGKCAGCGGKLNGDYHIDHIHPISKGGKNVDTNVQLLHGKCNLVKAAKWPWEVNWPQNPQISSKTS